MQNLTKALDAVSKGLLYSLLPSLLSLKSQDCALIFLQHRLSELE